MQELNAEQQSQRKKNQMKLLGIFAVATLPVVAAFVMYFGGVAIPGNTTNKGHLIWPPTEISALGTHSQSASAIIKDEQKWFLLLSGKGECKERCMDLLHTMRQVHISMGRELDRVGRMVIGSETAQREALLKQYPKLQIADLKPALQNKVAEALSGDTAPVDTWVVWLVDPLGNVLLRYDATHTGYDMINDLKKLLKLSNIG